MTWARTPDEEVILRRSLQQLAAAGLRVVVADGGSSSRFTDFVQRVPTFTMATPEGPGLVAQVQASLCAAARFGTPFIVYTEPDKEDFFKDRLLDFVGRATESGDRGVTLA